MRCDFVSSSSFTVQSANTSCSKPDLPVHIFDPRHLAAAPIKLAVLYIGVPFQDGQRYCVALITDPHTLLEKQSDIAKSFQVLPESIRARRIQNPHEFCYGSWQVLR
jgi:hypothetical protein